MDTTPPLPSHAALLQHAGWVRRLAVELVRDPAAADDVVQETWLAFLRARPDPARPLEPWLARVVRNHAALQRRRAAAREARERDAARAEAVPSAEELVGRAEAQRELVDAVLALAEPYRATLLLRYYEGLSPKEIAAARGLNGNTVRTHLLRGLEQLRGRLDAAHDGDRRAWATLLLPFLPRTAPAAIPFSPWALVGIPVVFGVLAVVAVLGLRAPHPAGGAGLSRTAVGDTSASGARVADRDTAHAARSARVPARGLPGSAESRVMRLVAASDGGPIAAYAIREAGGPRGPWWSDADGFVTVPGDVAAVIPHDPPRLGVDTRAEHDGRATAPMTRAPLRLDGEPASERTARGSEGASVDLAVPVGPTLLLRLDAPARLAPTELDVRLVTRLPSDYRDDGRPRLCAPVQAPDSLGSPLPFARFGDMPSPADLSGARVIAHVRDVPGFWHGTAELAPPLDSRPREVGVALRPTGTIRARVTGIDPALREPVGFALRQGDVVAADLPDGESDVLVWQAADELGELDVRWVAPGVYTLVCLSPLHERWARRLEVAGGEAVTLSVALTPKAAPGRVSGAVVSETGACREQLLVFVSDLGGVTQGVFPTTWRQDPDGVWRAPFLLDEVAAGPCVLEALSLASSVTARVEPPRFDAPRDHVAVTVLDSGPCDDVEVDVLVAATGRALDTFELEVRLDGGGPRRFAASRDDAGERSWLVSFGGMRWNRISGSAPLVRLPRAAALEWRVRAAGFAEARGGRAELEPRAEGRARLEVRLVPE